MTYTFRRALPAEVDRVIELLHARVEWLHNRGLDQWGSLDPARDTTSSVANGTTWILTDDDDVAVGTMNMTTTGNPGFWTPAELSSPALYLSKMATDPARAGRDLGELLLDSAKLYGSTRRIPRLRWDAWKTNQELQRYYSRIGAQYLRTVDLPGGWRSGALFESAYQVPRRPENVTVKAPSELFALLDSQHHEILTTSEMRTTDIQPGRTRLPDHFHTVPDLEYPNLGSVDGGTAGPAHITSDDSEGTLLFNPGTGWMASTWWAHPATGPALDDLNIRHPYRVRHVDHTPTGCGVGLFGDAYLPEHTTVPERI